MAIKYKKIIEEIMGEEAKKRGYIITSHPKLIVTKPLAILERTVNELHQSIDITEDLLHKGDVFIWFGGKKRIYHYEDEDSFRRMVGEINEFMISEGYEKMDGYLKMPYYLKADYEYVRSNFERDYNEYKINHNCSNIKDGLTSICTDIADTYNVEWSLAKERIVYISEVLTGIMLEHINNTYLTDGLNTEYFYVERIELLKRKAHHNPMNLVLNSYKNKDTEKWLIRFIKDFLTEEELRESNLENSDK